jgi:hypothetical protein
VLNSALDGIRETEEIDNDAITLLVNSALTSSAVRSALADLREAILEPDRTGAACYRAIEAMRQLYVRGEDSGQDRARSWASLRGVTGVPEADLRWLEQLAVPRRHGALMDVSSEERLRALRIGRAVIDGYLQATSEAPPLTAEVQLTLGAEVCGRGQHKYAAPCAGSRFTRLAPSLCYPDRPHCAEIPTHQSQAGRPTRHGCLMHQGLEQDVVQNPGSTKAATTSTRTQDQRPSLEHKGSLDHLPQPRTPHLPSHSYPLPDRIRAVIVHVQRLVLALRLGHRSPPARNSPSLTRMRQT